MKRKFLFPAVAMMLIASVSFTSCIGSFGLTNKLLGWNRQVGDKFVNELVFFAFWILPVYEVSLIADVIVLNSIEFWSGNSPVAQGKTMIEGNDGKYLVDCDGKGYTITAQNDGSVVRLDFNDADRSWSYSTPGNEPVVFMTFIDDTHVALPGYDNTERIVELSAGGVLAYSEYASGGAGLMARR